jgi:ArsR family transcriptional regulator
MAAQRRAVIRSNGRSQEPDAARFKALSDPHRLRLLATLAGAGESVCVCDLNECVPLLQPTVSHHLRVLKRAGLVDRKRRGTRIYYCLNADALTRLRKALDAITPRRFSK